jgi:hypothetical protein
MTKTTIKYKVAHESPLIPSDTRDMILDLRDRVAILEGYLKGSIQVIEKMGVACDTTDAKAAAYGLVALRGLDRVDAKEARRLARKFNVSEDRARFALVLYRGNMGLINEHLNVVVTREYTL